MLLAEQIPIQASNWKWKINTENPYERLERALVQVGEEQMLKNYGTTHPQAMSEQEWEKNHENVRMMMDAVQPEYEKLAEHSEIAMR